MILLNSILSIGFHYFYLIFTVLIIVYFLLLNFSYLFTTILSFRHLKKYAYRLKSIVVEDLVETSDYPAVTILSPAYNESTSIVDSVRSLLDLKYPDYEIIVINDGSTDSTLNKLKEAYNLEHSVRGPLSDIDTEQIKQVYRSSKHPELWVIDKTNGGKSDALNAGLNYCHSSLYCAIDSDTLLEKDALIRLVRPFLEDDTTIAAGGIVRIANGCEIENGEVKDVKVSKNLFVGFQVTEYLRAFLSGRVGWQVADSLLIISGAFGLFSREAVVRVRGYDTETVGEDMELVVKLHHFYKKNNVKYDITYIPDPVAWTEVPDNLSGLSQQRQRWQRGLYESLTKHKEMLLNPKYGVIGMLAFPYFYFLEMFGPLVEIPGYIFIVVAIILGEFSPLFTALFLMLAFVFGAALSIISIGLEELTFKRFKKVSSLIKLYTLSIFENFGFRQLTVFWRLKGLISAIRGKNKSWGYIERRGFNTSDKESITKRYSKEYK